MTWKSGDNVEIETGRFLVRSLTPEDVDETYTSWWNDDEIQGGFNAGPRNWTVERAAKHVATFNNQDKFHLGIFSKETGKLAGFVTAYTNLKQKTAATNVCIGDKALWGKDVVIEVRARVLDFLFDSLGMERVESRIVGRNLSSMFNNTALGYTLEGILRKQVPGFTGGRADIYIYGVLKEDWHAFKNKPEKTRLK